MHGELRSSAGSLEQQQKQKQTCDSDIRLLRSTWNGVCGRGCDEAEISEEKRLFH